LGSLLNCDLGEDEEEAAWILHELCRSRPQSGGKVKNVVGYPSTPVQKGDCLFVSTFLNIYPRHNTTWEVLELVMKRYGPFQPDSDEDELEKIAIMYFLGLWIEGWPEDFYQNLDLARLNQLMDYINLNMPSSFLVIYVRELLSKMEEQKSKEVIPQNEKACDPEPSGAAAHEFLAQFATGMPETPDPRPASAAERSRSWHSKRLPQSLCSWNTVYQ
ncbi:ral guanine nucleotide dissociation stimulator-like, partial [Nannospalax galili]|uniref:ral guanine nucleotide dissociation stimulator-like n=1 Tax=Nannospalax galili TaxID=1026970 RepID=UPI00111C8A81